MAGITQTLTAALLGKLRAPLDGVTVRIGEIEQSDGTTPAAVIRSIASTNASVDVCERAGHAIYPAVLIYCDKVSNTLKEKFRQFSGRARLVVEVRHSQDKLEGLETATQLYLDAVCALLDDSRGSWDGGAFYPGGYEVNYEPVARGGKNFLQRARVSFDVEVSK